MSHAARLLLGEDKFVELVAATRQIAMGLVDELDPYQTAVMVAVSHRLVHHQYGWTMAARGVALSLVIEAARVAEEKDREVAA